MACVQTEVFRDAGRSSECSRCCGGVKAPRVVTGYIDGITDSHGYFVTHHDRFDEPSSVPAVPSASLGRAQNRGKIDDAWMKGRLLRHVVKFRAVSRDSIDQRG